MPSTIVRKRKPPRGAASSDSGLRWSLVVAVNDDQVLESTLLASPAIDSNCEVIVRRGYSCAGAAYNSGLAEAQNDIVVFAHQDVYLPATWLKNLAETLDTLEAAGSKWGVLGCFGATQETPPRLHGYCFSTGLRRILGKPFQTLAPAQTLDELLLVVHRSSGLRFDEQLPGFHLYGADICLQAAASGLENFIIPAFCIHNANGTVRLPREFWRAYFYLRRKWRAALPVTTCCTTITAACMPIVHRLAVECKERLRPREVGRRCGNIPLLYEQLCQIHPELCGTSARS
jgi:Glycosyltransferase like family